MAFRAGCGDAIVRAWTPTASRRVIAVPLCRWPRVPPHTFFLVSASFHYLGPVFAVLLFARVAPLGVAWLRIASTAAVFAAWRRPWRFYQALAPRARLLVALLGGVLASMNACFYIAIDRLPLATVGAIESFGPIGLAAAGTRTPRNWAALGLAATGV